MANLVNAGVAVSLRFRVAKLLMLEHARRAIAQTGREIADQTKANMTPGHFLDTGLSQATTQWEQLSADGGQVHIPTEYAAYPELGTSRMAARPVLMPAILQLWPDRIHANWHRAHLLPPADPPTTPSPPISRP
jgi:hypothetical protein